MKTSLKRYRTLLSTYFKPFWKQVLLLFLLLMSGIILRLINPLILQSFIDSVVGGNPGTGLINDALAYLGIAITIQLFALGETYLATNLGLLSTNRLRTDLALHCLKLDLPFHNQHTPGEMIERVDGDAGTLGNFFSRFIIEIVGSVILMIGILIMMFRIDWRVGATFSTFALITLLIMGRLRDVAVPHFRKARQATAELFGFLEERLSGTEDVRGNGATGYVMRRLYEKSRPVLRRWVKAGAIGSSAFGSTWILFAIGTTVSLALGVYLYQKSLITIGVVYLIFRYAELLNQPLESINRQFQDLQQAGASAIRILDLMSLTSAIRDNGRTPIPGSQALAVQCEGVSFAYEPSVDKLNPMDASKPVETPSPADDLNLLHEKKAALSDKVLENITFNLPPGIILGLLGRTGSGKTTLTRLLIRFFEPLHGAIRLGGVILSEIPLAVLRQRIGLVTQEIQLFNASLRDNLTLFDPSIPDERILDALKQLGLMDWYHSLAEGLETKLEPGGSRLSAGEAQLLAFVRVFLRDPGLIILDEASSRLDPATEARLDRAIEQLLHGRTAIIIAHRLGTVQRADRIMILENGSQLEYGEREHLIANPESHFSELLRTGMEEALA